MKLIIITALLFFWAESKACQCLPMSVKDNFNKSNLVLQGKVIAVNSLQQFDKDLPKGSFRELQVATIKVTKLFKGHTTSDTVDVITGNGYADCGFKFWPKTTYIVYAIEKEYSVIDSTNLPSLDVMVSKRKYLYTDNCDRTTSKIATENKALKKFSGRRKNHNNPGKL